MTWRGTWKFKLEVHLIQAWELVTYKLHGNVFLVNREPLSGILIESHADAIHRLELAKLVIRPVSHRQIRAEQMVGEEVFLVLPTWFAVYTALVAFASLYLVFIDSLLLLYLMGHLLFYSCYYYTLLPLLFWYLYGPDPATALSLIHLDFCCGAALRNISFFLFSFFLIIGVFGMSWHLIRRDGMQQMWRHFSALNRSFFLDG